MNQLKTENQDLLIPIPFSLIRKASRTNEILRDYFLNYCLENKIAEGFSSYEIIFSELPVLIGPAPGSDLT